MLSFSGSMRRVRRHGASWLLLAALSSHLAFMAIPQVWAAAPEGTPPTQEVVTTHEFTLANGLRLIVKEDHRAPTVAHMVWYNAGSIDEHNGTTGVAHVLEHMMFKGTETLAAGEFSRRVAALGGRENAFTGRDYTAYHQQIEKSKLPEVMRLEADRMAHLKLSKEEFDKEIKVVMEERRWRTEDQAHGTLFEQMLATAFTASPYQHPTVGWMNDLENMSYRDAQLWYERWYAPNNALVIVAGDVQPQEVLRLAEQAYGAIPAKPLPERKPQVEPPQIGMKRIAVKAPAENPYIALAWKAPSLRDIEKDDDVYALQVLAAVLDGYDNARLNRHMIRQQRLADEVGASYSPAGRGPQLFMMDARPAQGHTTEEMEKALRAEVANIAKHGVTEAELKRVKAQVVAGQIYKRDSVIGQAMEIGFTELAGFSWRQIDRSLERLKAVTPAQVQAVAAKYFGDDTLTVATLLPQPIDPNKKPASTSGLRH